MPGAFYIHTYLLRLILCTWEYVRLLSESVWPYEWEFIDSLQNMFIHKTRKGCQPFKAVIAHPCDCDNTHQSWPNLYQYFTNLRKVKCNQKSVKNPCAFHGYLHDHNAHCTVSHELLSGHVSPRGLTSNSVHYLMSAQVSPLDGGRGMMVTILTQAPGSRSSVTGWLLSRALEK